MLANSFDTNIDLALDLDTTLWNTKLDGNHLAQVLLNFCVNARDTMSSEGGGIIEISTANFVDPEGKEFIRIGVKDSGVGEDEGMLKHLGYAVTCATNGQEGMDYLKTHADEIDLVITDLTMPVMSGK